VLKSITGFFSSSDKPAWLTSLLLWQVLKSVGQAEARFGPLDVVIANAGMPSSGTLL